MFQKYTTGKRTTLHNLESVKVTTQKVGQCKTHFSSYELKTVQRNLKFLSELLWELGKLTLLSELSRELESGIQRLRPAQPLDMK